MHRGDRNGHLLVIFSLALLTICPYVKRVIAPLQKGHERFGTLHLLGSGGIPDGTMGSLYHEKQVQLLCGVHALNTLLQGPYFT